MHWAFVTVSAAANPVDMASEGFSIINANDNLLYIVPKAGYYHDFLDTQMLYEQWEPNIFSLSDPSLNLQPGGPHLLGGMFSDWNDRLGSVISDADVYARFRAAAARSALPLRISAARRLSHFRSGKARRARRDRRVRRSCAVRARLGRASSAGLLDSFLRVDQNEGHLARLIAAIRPGVVGASLNGHIARFQVNL